MARNKYDVDEELLTKFKMKDLIRLLRYLKPYKMTMFVTVLLMLTASVANLVGPLLVQDAMDYKIPAGNIKGLVFLSGIFIVTLIVNAICFKFRVILMSQLGNNVVKKIREDIFYKIQKLPFSYYDSRPHGKILVRVVNYVNSLSDLLTNGFINFITDMFTLVCIIVFMLFINVKLTLISMIGLPPLFICIMLIKNIQRKNTQALSMKQSNLNAYIHESICGVKVTQSFAREEQNQGIFHELNKIYRRAWMRFVKANFILWPIIETISTIGIIILYFGGIFWVKGITIGVLIAFTSYISRFWQPITNLGNFYNAMINAMAYLERIFETLDEEVSIENLPGAIPMPEVKGAVEFRNVSFSYEEGKKILDNINFTFRLGSTIALVGPTGAGKSTIINLLSRFYDVQEGEVLIDGINIRDVQLETLRKQMGVMLQDTFLFSGTVMSNIKYARPDATDEEAIRAAKTVCAHEFIMNMSNGYYTEINERGTRLSIGERQLISFARALLADPRILILDEATSSIDTRTELALQKGLQGLLVGRTSFIIAHRLSTIKNAHCIMYVDNGSIVERGTHDELMAARGHYYNLYNSQFSVMEAV
ncbi:ABC transporter related protein [Ruminiclostridium papyrosolvens DSM 2782]|uniref:ABC transporter related protein n=1 Tax=Ruminiclostridium papyrosolvens DSM 2782 TaxID=588581 RepID=F1T9L2_9FIRM|nr:ABC transporter ATP-binding protein [Ruminiclostridium papyrosolvens]EGD49194.1 ABC transporter related protein [Ruminiclostridium papyrosolvens DSM 2782]WES35673.1 ABC transporter ATP-binding protein [Ruminiclostridium papyrosolvens DSM 2782]